MRGAGGWRGDAKKSDRTEAKRRANRTAARLGGREGGDRRLRMGDVAMA